MPGSFSLDPKTAILIATLMMLLNGGVLGLMHRELAEDVRPSALNWRLGTLLQAFACVLLVAADAHRSQAPSAGFRFAARQWSFIVGLVRLFAGSVPIL